MSDKLIKKIVATEQARRLVLDELHAMPLDKIKYVSYGDAKRTHLQNARFHAFCADTARQKQWAGLWLDTDAWKCLYVSGHARATGNISDPIFGLENDLVCIRESTADMGVKRMASLLEYQKYWCADNDIIITAPKWMWDVK